MHLKQEGLNLETTRDDIYVTYNHTNIKRLSLFYIGIIDSIFEILFAYYLNDVKTRAL